MSAHDHTTRVPGCFRGELSEDEAPDGQRGFVTTGLIAEAASIGAQRHTEDDQ